LCKFMSGHIFDIYFYFPRENFIFRLDVTPAARHLRTSLSHAAATTAFVARCLSPPPPLPAPLPHTTAAHCTPPQPPPSRSVIKTDIFLTYLFVSPLTCRCWSRRRAARRHLACHRHTPPPHAVPRRRKSRPGTCRAATVVTWTGSRHPRTCPSSGHPSSSLSKATTAMAIGPRRRR
jgi:hypothetical protein